VRIVEVLTKEHTKTSLWAHLRMVHRVKTNKATIGREEEVCIGTSQAGEGVECSTVYCYEDGRGEARLREEYPRDGYGRGAIDTSTNEGVRKMKGRTEDPRIPAERSQDASD
jgi:hypothetical protein